jgi:hypothetical protein
LSLAEVAVVLETVGVAVEQVVLELVLVYP